MTGPSRPLTEVAQSLVAKVVRSGETVVDATAGNGHDTLFLAQCVGPTGHVYAFDVQRVALDATAERLLEAGVTHVTLCQADHSQLATALPDSLCGRVAAVMFNLGYLPGGDKSITTQPETTLIALQDAMQWLRPGGAITLLIYSGHTTGKVELAALQAFLGEEHLGFVVTEVDPQRHRQDPPRLFVISRRPNEESSC